MSLPRTRGATPITVRRSRGIALAAVLTAVVLAGAIGLALWGYHVALRADDEAVATYRDGHTAQEALTLLWREREAMNEYLLVPRPATLREVTDMHARFDRTLASVRIESAREAELVTAARQLNDRLAARFRDVRQTAGAAGAEEATRLLNAVEPDVLAVLGELQAQNNAEAAEALARADRSGGRALPLGVGAGLIGLVGVLAFAWYAARLVRLLRRQNADLQQLDQLKDGFVASVSHELRTPLTSIRGYLELVLDGEAGPLNGEQEQFLRVVERNADRLLGLVGDLLFVAQVDAGKLELEVAECDLSEILAASVEGIRPLAESKEITVETAAASPVPVAGDAGRLGQLADNLLSNAVKFTPDGGQVRVATGLDGGHPYLEVSDTGIGITPEDQGQLFERFFRTSSATERSIQGTGLGLSIVKAIAEAHGGRISVSSVPGEGTSFRLELPITAPERRSLEEGVAA